MMALRKDFGKVGGAFRKEKKHCFLIHRTGFHYLDKVALSSRRATSDRSTVKKSQPKC